MRSAALAVSADRLARYAAIAIGFSLPLSTALDNVLLGLLLLGWLLGGRFQEKGALIRRNPVALSALALFGLAMIGLCWGDGPLSDGLVYLKKYSNLIVIALLVTVFTRLEDRTRALHAFAAALILSLVLSFALWLRWLPAVKPVVGDALDPTVFKTHIGHSILMAFGALLFALFAHDARRRGWRLLWAVLAVAAAANVLMMVRGRTGYVLVAAFAVLLPYTLMRWKGVALAAALIAVGFGTTYALSPRFHQRIDMISSEARSWQPGTITDNSIGVRLEFYRNTLEIIREHPVIGVGTSGFAKAYDEKIRGKDLYATRNPHNLYLLVAAQYGILGLCLLFFLFVQQWRCSAKLMLPTHQALARAAVMTLALGGLCNSMIIDHTESLFFAWMSGLLFAGLNDPHPRKEPPA
jgi:O-antigen ligase